MSVATYVGKGLIFPIQIDSKGSPVIGTGFPLINSSIKIILSWTFRTRIFLSEFGSRLSGLLEEPNDDILLHLVEHFAYEALTKWERRIDILDTLAVRTSDAGLTLRITYRIKNSGLENTFVFPFYTAIIY